MSLRTAFSGNSGQPADENEQPAGEPVTEQSTADVTDVTDDPTVAPADYDYAEDDAPVATVPDDDVVPAADYGRGNYADETPATGIMVDDTTVPAQRATSDGTTSTATQSVPVMTTPATTADTTTGIATTGSVEGPLLGDVDAAELRTRWQQVQADFVDDPTVAVGEAADLVEQTAQAVVEALQQRQRQMRGQWQQGQASGGTGGTVGDTEQLRMMMQQYRTMFTALCER